MDFGISDILGIGASALSGGIFGLVSSVLSKAISFGMNYFKEKQRQEWEKEKWGYEERMAKLQMERSAQETENELAIVASKGSWDNLSQSIKADAETSRNTHKWVNDVKAMFRPFLTIALFVISYMIFRDLMSAIETGSGNLMVLFSEKEMRQILMYIIQAIVFSASTACVWWFGDRALLPEGSKQR